MRARRALILSAIAGLGCSSGGSSTGPGAGLNLSGSWTYRDSTAIRYLYTGDGTEVRVRQVHYGPETIASSGSQTWTMSGSDSILLYDSTTSTPHPGVSASAWAVSTALGSSCAASGPGWAALTHELQAHQHVLTVSFAG